MRGIITGIVFCIIFSFTLTSCGESDGPPIPIREVQVEASYFSEGYDVYQYVAITKPLYATPDHLNMLLDYFEDKYGDEGKVKVMVFPDAASAIQAVSSRVLATLEMENGEVTRRTVNVK